MMSSMFTRARLAWVTALVAVVAVVAGVSVAKFGSDELPADAVFRIDDDVVTEDDFNDRVTILEALYGVRAPEADVDLEQFRRDAAKSMAVSLILDRAAEAEGITIAAKQATDRLADIVEDQLPTGRQGFVQFLETSGVTEADVVEEVRLQLITSRLFEQITSEVADPTDAEVEGEFDRRRAELITPERRRLSNIVVADRDAALALRTRLRAGASFAAAARSESLDEASRARGGDLGLVSLEELLPAYGSVVFAAEPGVAFGPIKSQYGWNVGLVSSIVAERPLTFAQAAPRLKAQLLDERRLTAWREWLSGQIADADVTYADKYRPDDPDEPPRG